MLLQPERFRHRPLGWHIASTVAQNRIARLRQDLSLSGGAQVHPHHALRQRRSGAISEQNVTRRIDGQSDDLASINAARLQTSLDRQHKRLPPVRGMFLSPARTRIACLIALIREAEW